MKKLLSIIVTLLILNTMCIGGGMLVSQKFLPPAYAEGEDLWGNFNTDLSSPKEQRFVSDEEFEQAIKKKNKKLDKWKKILLNNGSPRGEQFSESNETEAINNNQGADASLPVLALPVEIKMGEGSIPVGHYQVEGKNEDGRIVLNLYQSHNLVARIPATETNEDYEQEEILFASWVSQDDNHIKIIYGSLDFNAYALVDILQ
ncbi:hypothetical protein J6O86_03150 [bacterium]|nr:hypothetical protein [bacterium]